MVSGLSGPETRDATVIDARGKTVMPGGVDSHSHVAGTKVNTGRLMRPEDHYRSVRKKTDITHSGSGYTVPSVYKQGYDYAAMGYTTVFEAAMPPLEARHTHEEMRSTPILDMGAYMVFGNNWFIMRYLKEGDIEKGSRLCRLDDENPQGLRHKMRQPGGRRELGLGQERPRPGRAQYPFRGHLPGDHQRPG